MKINEKNLSAFATSATPIDREGWLVKRGDVNKAYQKRWFVLKGNLLFYFEKRGDKEPVGVIVLEGCTIELAEDEEQFSFKIVFHGAGNRSYVLGAESQESMEAWMKALACASYDYMKLMVAELQRQLDEMEEMDAAGQIRNVTAHPEDGLSQLSLETKADISPGDKPQAPPRQRHNPFNKTEDPSGLSHSRSQSLRVTGSIKTENVPRTKISFKELHESYGKRILKDRCNWPSIEKKEVHAMPVEVKEELLITL